MTGKLFGKAFILLIFYLFICSLIYFISYFALTKKNFIDIPVFKSIQRNLYYELFVEVWQNKPECVSFDEDLIYVPKIGSCKHQNAEFDTILNFTNSGRLMPKITNKNAKSIVVLGDSHAMGWGVNDKETFSYFLQDLAKQPVYNLAVSSYGTEREIVRLEKSGLLENSDIIIIQYHENDLKENENFHKIKKDEYMNIFTNMTSLKKNKLTIMKKTLRQYKSSLRQIFTKITNNSRNKTKKLDFKPHYIPLIESIKKIKNFSEKRIIIFYSDSPSLRFDNFPNGFDEKYSNVYFYNIYNSEFSEELNSEENYFFLDRHPNKFGHRKIAQSLYNVLKLDIFNN